VFRRRILIAVLLAVSACSTTYHEGPKSCSRDLDCPAGQRCVEETWIAPQDRGVWRRTTEDCPARASPPVSEPLPSCGTGGEPCFAAVLSRSPWSRSSSG
jgi:hypothetical protein